LPSAGTIGNDCGLQQSRGLNPFTVQGRYPFIAAIGIKNREHEDKLIYGCVGSLINRRYVVTAAVCHFGSSQIVEVLLGEFDFTKDPDCIEQGCQSSEFKFILAKPNLT
jgi:hypothetical protein